MHEYEFRLAVRHSSSFTLFFENLGLSTRQKVVYYAKPHFRFKNGTWEVKRVESTHFVYHDDVWFKWVHSVEIPYEKWKESTIKSFLHETGNFQNPFTEEIRDFVEIDSQAQLYAFKSGSDYKLVFEWEYGTFKKRPENFEPGKLLDSLNRYKRIYDAMRHFSTPSYQLNENVFRKPVTCVQQIPDGNQYLYAHKMDGIFGLVYSYPDRVKENWEGYECVVRHKQTLGDGYVFAAEKMESGEIVLLDVYQVRGFDTASWCRRGILLDFLPQLKLVEGYFVQTYVSNKNLLGSSPFKTDGIIIHDVERDDVFKYKTNHSIDLVYFKGYFHLPNGRIKCLEKNLEDGRVYEISTSDGRVVRKRIDRFKGNTAEQLENVFVHGWHGPPVEYQAK